MKQNTITLREAIQKFPISWMKFQHKNIPDNFNELNFSEKLRFVGNENIIYYLSVKNDNLFFGLKEIVVKRVGKTIYKSSRWTDTIVVSSSKVSIKDISLNSVKTFLSIIGINFFDTLNGSESMFLRKSFMIAAILRKKVYNIETYFKQILACSYKLHNFDWKLFRRFFKSHFMFPLNDLLCFTKNLTNSMREVINSEDDYDKLVLLQDILKCAVKLDEIVDFTWSNKRLQIEHNRQNSKLHLKELESKDEQNIYNISLDTENIKLLNTEKQVFLEGLNMHHCLYNCYWQNIKEKRYIAFHMNFPEDCTFSCKLVNGKLIFDQIYLAYDKQVLPETKEIARQFIDANYKEILSLLDVKSSYFDPSNILRQDLQF